MDKKVDEAFELVMGMCRPDVMSPEDATTFLEEVIGRLEEEAFKLGAEDES